MKLCPLFLGKISTENKGDACDFSVTDPIGWSLHLSSLVSGTIIYSNRAELTYFDSGSSPKFGGSIFLAGDVTRLCRRIVMGEITDEIILDEYPSNI